MAGGGGTGADGRPAHGDHVEDTTRKTTPAGPPPPRGAPGQEPHTAAGTVTVDDPHGHDESSHTGIDVGPDDGMGWADGDDGLDEDTDGTDADDGLGWGSVSAGIHAGLGRSA